MFLSSSVAEFMKKVPKMFVQDGVSCHAPPKSQMAIIDIRVGWSDGVYLWSFWVVRVNGGILKGHFESIY